MSNVNDLQKKATEAKNQSEIHIPASKYEDIPTTSDNFPIPVELMIVIAILAVAAVYHFTKIGKMKSNNFNLYRENNPNHVNGGKVTCNSCGGANIGTERVMKNTYMRAHICRSCGTTLYYSPEK